MEQKLEKSMKKLVKERQQYIEKVVNFVHNLLTGESECLKFEEHNSHCYQHRRLILDKFTFEDEGSFTMFGGDEVTIWYDGFKVFQVKYWDIKKCEVLEFDINMPCPDWRTPLNALMRNGPKRVASRAKWEKERSKKKAETQNKNLMQQVKEQMELEEEARRLHV